MGVPVGGYHDEVMPDKGCDVWPRCLECPLSLCKYDSIEVYHEWKRQQGIPVRRGTTRRGIPHRRKAVAGG